MNISKETREALLGDLSDSELREELKRREAVFMNFFVDGNDGRHVYVRKLERGGDTYHLLAGNGDIVWLHEEAVRGMIDNLTQLLAS